MDEDQRQRIEKLLSKPIEPAWKWPLMVGGPAVVVALLLVAFSG